MTSGAVSGSWIVGHRLSGRVKSCLQGSRDRKWGCSRHWEGEAQDNEAVRDEQTGHLVPPPGDSSLGGQDTHLETPRAQPCPSRSDRDCSDSP